MGLTDPRKAFGAALLQLGQGGQQNRRRSHAIRLWAAAWEISSRHSRRERSRRASANRTRWVYAPRCAAGHDPGDRAITPFLTMRAYEQVRDDVGYMNTNVKIVGSGGGLAYSTLGSTHQAVEDVALMRTIPNMAILSRATRTTSGKR